MPSLTRPAPSLADVAALALALERDQGLAQADRAAQDARLAPLVHAAGAEAAPAAQAWLEARLEQDADLRAGRARIAAAADTMGATVFLLGVVVGTVAALGTFYYDGGARVNVLSVLALFVFLPALLLLPLLLAALPPAAAARLPGAGAFRQLGLALNAGRLARFGLRLLPHETRQAWERAHAVLTRHQVLYHRLQTWTLLRWSQVFAVAYQLAALVTAVLLVVFSDLAFGWSTTLTTGSAAEDARRVHRITATLATPWRWAVDTAAPDQPLIADSRYYRAVDSTVSPEIAARLGAWWRFVVACMLVYGLFPRLILLGLAHQRWRAHRRHAFAHAPGLEPLLRRLHRAHLRTTADVPSDQGPPPRSAEPAPAPAVVPPSERAAALINWAGTPLADATLAGMFGEAPVHHAGGSAELSADEAVIRELAAERRDGSVVIIVKAWEPPLLELTDFLRELRAAVGPHRPIEVVPVGQGDRSEPVPADAAATAVWRRKLQQVGDPWLHLTDLQPLGRS